MTKSPYSWNSRCTGPRHTISVWPIHVTLPRNNLKELTCHESGCSRKYKCVQICIGCTYAQNDTGNRDQAVVCPQNCGPQPWCSITVVLLAAESAFTSPILTTYHVSKEPCLNLCTVRSNHGLILMQETWVEWRAMWADDHAKAFVATRVDTQSDVFWQGPFTNGASCVYGSWCNLLYPKHNCVRATVWVLRLAYVSFLASDQCCWSCSSSKEERFDPWGKSRMLDAWASSCCSSVKVKSSVEQRIKGNLELSFQWRCS